MLITSLSVPGKHLDCTPRPYGKFSNIHYFYFKKNDKFLALFHKKKIML